MTVLEKALEETEAPVDDEKDAVLSPEPVYVLLSDFATGLIRRLTTFFAAIFSAEAVVDSIASTEPGSPGAPAGEPLEFVLFLHLTRLSLILT